MTGEPKSFRAFTAAVLLLSAAFGVRPVAAQIGLPPEIRHRDPLRDPQIYETPVRSEIKSAEGPSVVSVDLLRHRLNQKARRMLQKAWDAMQSGHHRSAIQQLQATLAKYPDSDAYVHSLLGIEYLRTDQFEAAVDSFEKAVMLLPHDAINRYNLGLSLICAGDYHRGEQAVRRALEIDPANPTIRALLDALQQRQVSQRQSEIPPAGAR